MNAKLCKQMRRVAAELSRLPVTEKKYKIGAPGNARQVRLTVDCGRAAYHRLKKEFRK